VGATTKIAPRYTECAILKRLGSIQTQRTRSLNPLLFTVSFFKLLVSNQRRLVLRQSERNENKETGNEVSE
jgi:hypothetical protein